MIRRVLTLLAALAVAGVVLFFAGGFHQIDAIRQHPAWAYHGLAIVRDALVSIRSDEVALPGDFTPAATPEGAALYQKHCTHCHGAPGLPPEDFALGMMPVPTNLVHAAQTREGPEILWFIRYGLKMTGMPSWEGRMSDPDMRRLTAFVEALPSLSPRGYAELLERAGGPRDAVEPRPPARIPASVAEADPDRGRIAMQLHACRSCHLIPGLVGADVRVGPPLGEAGARRYIGGVLANTPENMVRWLMNPRQVDPLSAMPDVGLTLGEARDMAAYLYEIARKEPIPCIAPIGASRGGGSAGSR